MAGFESEELAQLPVSALAPDDSGMQIEVRRSDGSAVPASVTLARYSYQPGGRISLPYPYPGPVAYYVESGTLTLEAIGPNVRIVEVKRRTSTEQSEGMTVLGPSMLTAGGRYEVAADNFDYALDGNLGPTRNDGSEPLVVLAVFLQPQSGGESREASNEAATSPPVR